MRRRLIDRLPLDEVRRADLERRLAAVPRTWELRSPAGYRRGMEAHAQMWDGGFTMLGAARGRALLHLASEVRRRGVPGDLLDCGVWNGGSTILMSLGAPERRVWAFDSFQGLPAPGPSDGEQSAAFAGECVGAEAKLLEGFTCFADPSRLEVRKGWFEQTLPAAAPAIDRVALLHVDGDWYESVKVALESFYEKVSPGGYVIIDDYGTWVGARQATDEFRAAVGDRAPLRRIDHTGRFWRKY
jgi:O-methyltransferase